MKKIFTLLLSGLISSSLFSQAPPVLAKWTFEGVTTTNTGTTPTFSVGSAQADLGVKAATSNFTGLHASAATVWSNPAGNGSLKAVSSNTWGVNDYYQFSLSTTGYAGISVSVDHNGSGTGPGIWKFQYSTDGTNFTDFGSPYTIPASITWNNATPNAAGTTTFSFDLSSVTALNNAATVYFRVVDNSTTSISGGAVGTGGTSRVDNITVSGFTIFPINLLSFNGSLNNNSVSLSWATTNEVNTSGFEIQRSANGRDFSTISFVSAKGSLINNSYSLLDEKSISGTNYYRLKMVDKDGSVSYSQVVSIKTKSIGIGVYPNPVKGELTVQHEGGIKGATISVLNFEGKEVMRASIQVGATQTSLDATKLAPGTYMVIYNNNGERLTKQFIKQ
jgi:hypothetical protein